ncbi:MAG TPA: twin-arginine translocation signal domain-containing protein [Actinomycetota bacterium]
MVEHVDSDERGVSRRQVLRGAAVAGAAAWAAPVIQTINPATAYAGTPQEACYSVKISTGGGCSPEQNPNGYHCIDPETGDDGGCGFVAASARTPNDDTGTITVTIASGCTLVDGASKCGSSGCTSPQEIGPNTWLFTPCPSGPHGQNQGISGVELTICCSGTVGDVEGGTDEEPESDGDVRDEEDEGDESGQTHDGSDPEDEGDDGPADDVDGDRTDAVF